MAEINFNNIYDQMSGTVKNSYDGAAFGQSFSDQYDPDKRVANIDEVTGLPTGTFTDTNPNSLTMKDGYTQMVDAYNQEQQSETKNSFLGSLANFGSADAAMPDQTYGLQNSMMGMSINPDGSLNYNNTQPQNLGFRSMVDMANDANNFDSQFVSPNRFNSMGQMGPVKSNMNAPTIDRSNVMGEDIDMQYDNPNYEDIDMGYTNNSFNTQPRQGILQGLQDKIGAGFNNVKDFAMDKGRMGRNLLGSAGAMALGLPGIVGSGAMALMGGLKNQFQDRQLTGDIQDEYGNMYSADELNSQNALGGYYTDPARSARRRTSRIAKMRARDFNNKKISQTNLDRLVRQEKAQQLRDAKDAADRANIQNVQNYTGRELSGYRMSRPASERNYTGGSTNSNPSARGAQDSFSNRSGMGRTGYQEGGLASMFTRRR